jgi:epsilon-lactone hydrolase
MRRIAATIATLALAVSSVALLAQDKPVKPVFAEDGTVHVPAFDLPPSQLSSAEARAAQAMRAKMGGGAPPNDIPVDVMRRGLEAALAPQVDAMKKLYAVDIVDQPIDGVPTQIIKPHGRDFDHTRLLINLHGGGFSMCADACALLESIPLAGLGGFEVITINYRMGPEAKHPAALEDIEKVYRRILPHHKPSSIGIYGCSAGGALTAQIAAWLPMHGLPQPGAIGIFGSGGVRFMQGDSAYVAAYIDGSFPPPLKPGEQRADMARGYFDGVAKDDPVMSPALHPEIVAKFPPALIITGTRAMDMSPAIVTNSALIKARVPSTLIVGEGMGHCYIYQPGLPEARDAHQAEVDFFRANLK